MNMLKMMRTALTVATVAMALTAPAQAAVQVSKIQAMLAKPAVMCGRFDQTKTLADPSVVDGKGVLWRTLKSFPSTLRLTRDEIVNYQGDRVAMRLDAKTEPTVRMINNVLFSLLSGDLAQLESLFEVDGAVDATSWNVSLKAKQAALEKAIGTIRLDGGAYVKNIVMSEASGDRTAIVFSEIKAGDAAMTAEEAALF